MIEQCDKCRFWAPGGLEECRRYAPRPREMTAAESTGIAPVWPTTLADDWCGEFVSSGENRK